MTHEQEKRRAIVVGTVLIVLVLVAGSLMFLTHGNSYEGPIESITITAPSLEQNALIYVAESQGLFARNGIRITIINCSSGVEAIDRMVAGEANISVAAEFPFVNAVLRNESISVIACEDKFENDYILFRSDRGISKPEDLMGKRIGLVRQSIAEFYLGRYLDIHGMDIQDVTVVDQSPSQSQEAIASGSVDAVVVWQPNADQIQKNVSNVTSWPVQNSQAVFGVLAAKNDWLAQHGPAVVRFLRSLVEAEDFLVSDLERSKAIVKEKLNYDDSYISNVWTKHNYRVTLDQTLIVAMKDEARWLIDNGLTVENQIPDMVSHIYLEGLLSVSPRAVTVIE